ncbi:MAG: hypothetical protein Q9195_007696 [Heterodermia aff. obscurata]
MAVEACFMWFCPSRKSQTCTALQRLIHFRSSRLLCGLEPSKILELKSKQNVDFTWQADARLGYIAHAVETLSSQKKTASELECESNTKKDLLSRLDQIIKDKAELQSVIDDALKDRLAKLLFLEVDAIDDSKTLGAYGIDSMIAAELSNWLMRVFNVDVGFLDILDPSATVAKISSNVHSLRYSHKTRIITCVPQTAVAGDNGWRELTSHADE